MKKRLIILAMALFIMTMACGQGGSEYIGTWKSEDGHTMVITQTNDKWFKVVAFNQDAGEYKYEDGALVSTNTRLPVIAINKANGKIILDLGRDFVFTKAN